MARAGDPSPNPWRLNFHSFFPDEIGLSDDTEHKWNYGNRNTLYHVFGSIFGGEKKKTSPPSRPLPSTSKLPPFVAMARTGDPRPNPYKAPRRLRHRNPIRCFPDEIELSDDTEHKWNYGNRYRLYSRLKMLQSMLERALLGHGRLSFLRNTCEELHDLKMYALGMPQSRMSGDVGGSETSAPPPPLILDSGATRHVVGDVGILSNGHDPPAEMVVAVADGFLLRATKVGDIQTPDIKIADVHFVPGLNMNLISVRQLAKNKIVTTFYENHAELWLEGTQIGGAILDESGCLYKLRYLHDMN